MLGEDPGVIDTKVAVWTLVLELQVPGQTQLPDQLSKIISVGRVVVGCQLPRFTGFDSLGRGFGAGGRFGTGFERLFSLVGFHGPFPLFGNVLL